METITAIVTMVIAIVLIAMKALITTEVENLRSPKENG
jgi:hypothetical protein